MLSRFKSLTSNIMNVIIYCTSPSLEYHLKTELRNTYAMHRDFIVNVDTAKALTTAKTDALVTPLFCDKWLIHVNADKLTKKDLNASLSKLTMHGITVYWTTKFQIYKQLKDSEMVKKQGAYCPTFTFSRLQYGDILYLHKETLPENKKLDDALLHFLAKNYTFDVQAVMDLFSMLRSGSDITTKRELIEAIGVGGNSISRFTVMLLGSNFASEKTKAKRFKYLLSLLEDLSVTYSYESIRRFMLNTLEAFIDIKQLQIMGIYGKIGKEIPDTYDTKRISMNRRFDGFVTQEVNLPRLLNLKLCISKYNNFDAQLAMVQIVSEYLNSLPYTAKD